MGRDLRMDQVFWRVALIANLANRCVGVWRGLRLWLRRLLGFLLASVFASHATIIPEFRCPVTGGCPNLNPRSIRVAHVPPLGHGKRLPRKRTLANKVEKGSRCHNTSSGPRVWKMLHVPSHKVFGRGRFGTFKEDVIAWIRTGLNPGRSPDPKALLTNCS
jgi:hypothetical protein